MKILSKFMIVLVMTLFIATGCDKGDDNTDPNQNTLPTNESEAFDLITKKWDLPNSTEYRSIEFTKDGFYFIDKVEQKSTNYDGPLMAGRYNISDDGKTTTLDDFGTMTIDEVINEYTINITIIIINGGGNIEMELVKSEISNNTDMLCKQWESTGEGFDITFYKSGVQTVYWEGEPEHTFAWSWTDENETNINWQVDNDGNASDWLDAQITLTDTHLTVSSSAGTFSFIEKE